MQEKKKVIKNSAKIKNHPLVRNAGIRARNGKIQMWVYPFLSPCMKQRWCQSVGMAVVKSCVQILVWSPIVRAVFALLAWSYILAKLMILASSSSSQFEGLLRPNRSWPGRRVTRAVMSSRPAVKWAGCRHAMMMLLSLKRSRRHQRPS